MVDSRPEGPGGFRTVATSSYIGRKRDFVPFETIHSNRRIYSYLKVVLECESPGLRDHVLGNRDILPRLFSVSRLLGFDNGKSPASKFANSRGEDEEGNSLLCLQTAIRQQTSYLQPG